MRTSQHGYVRVVRLTHRSRVFQHKQGSRFHLLWNPLSKQLKLRQHAIPPVRSCYLCFTTPLLANTLPLSSASLLRCYSTFATPTDGAVRFFAREVLLRRHSTEGCRRPSM